MAGEDTHGEHGQGVGVAEKSARGCDGPGKVCGRDPEGKGLRRKHVMACISQRNGMDTGTRQLVRKPIKRMYPS